MDEPGSRKAFTLEWFSDTRNDMARSTASATILAAMKVSATPKLPLRVSLRTHIAITASGLRTVQG